ncbi:hypothetical protein D3C72_1327250 [compost metagenome]
MGRVGQLADDGFPVVVDVDTHDFVARHHDVVNAHFFQIQHRQQHVLIPARNLRAGFMDDGAQLVFAQCAADHHVGFYTDHAHQQAGNHVEQPDQRHHQDQQRAEQEAARIGDFLRVEGGDGFRQDFSKHQDDKRQYTGRNRDTGVAIEAHPNNSAQRGGENIDQVVADQHQANQTIGLAQQLFNASGGTVALFSAMT